MILSILFDECLPVVGGDLVDGDGVLDVMVADFGTAELG